MADGVAAARTALEQSEGRRGPERAGRAAIWHWDLASGKMQWDEGLKALFGYAEMVTDVAWRESRIHPEDRERVAAPRPGDPSGRADASSGNNRLVSCSAPA